MKGERAEAVGALLGLASEGGTVEYGESFFTGCALESGWYLIFINRCEHDFVRPSALERLSNDREIVGVSIEEHVMVSTATLWRNGRQVWSVEHDAQKGIDHLAVAGDLPASFGQIIKEFVRRQKHADESQENTDYIFDIPLQVAKNIVGFKHDEEGMEDEKFQVFKQIRSAASGVSGGKDTRPWWRFWG